MIYAVKKGTKGDCISRPSSCYHSSCYKCLCLKKGITFYVADEPRVYEFLTKDMTSGAKWCSGIQKKQLIPVNTEKRKARFLLECVL